MRLIKIVTRNRPESVRDLGRRTWKAVERKLATANLFLKKTYVKPIKKKKTGNLIFEQFKLFFNE